MRQIEEISKLSEQMMTNSILEKSIKRLHKDVCRNCPRRSLCEDGMCLILLEELPFLMQITLCSTVRLN